MRDLERLQGRWRPVRFEENGLLNPPDTHSAPNAILTIKEHHFHVAVPGEVTILEGRFTLDGATQPPTIIWVDAIGEDAGKSFEAIYRLSEHDFIFVAADEGMPRPTQFEGGPGLTLRAFVRA